MSIEKTGDWELAERILASAPREIDRAMAKAVHQEALHFERLVKLRLQSGPPPPLSPWTIAGRKSGGGKGGDKPLNASGDMLGSISVVPNTIKEPEKFIGIPRAATGHNGQVMNLADIHEFGRTIVIRVTPKMRRFLFGVLLKNMPAGGGGKGGGGKKIMVIRIPARPFIVPAFEEGAKEAQGRFEARMFKLLEPAMNGKK